MELTSTILKLIGITLITLALGLIVKETEEFSKTRIGLYMKIVTSIIVFTMVMFQFGTIIDGINTLAKQANIPSMYITLIIKLIGIAFLVEFAVKICESCSETILANKLKFGANIIIMVMAFPVMLTIIETILNIIP